MAITLDGSNGISSPDFEPSSSTAPTNGLFLPTTNTIAWATNSTERLRLDASGNLGLGVTPNTWSLGKNIEIGNSGNSIMGRQANDIAIGTNLYYNAGYKYAATAAAALYEQTVGGHYWFNAPSGTAGNAISFTQAMTLDASGRLGIGTSSPVQPLQVMSGGGSGTLSLSGSGTGVGGASYILMGNSDSGGASGPVVMASANRNLQFGVGTSFSSAGGGTFTEYARIDSSGNLLVGTTSTTPVQSNTAGFKVGGGQIECQGSNTQAAFFGRSNDGQVIRFFNAGTAAGNISNTGTTTSYNGTSDYRLKENIQPMSNALATVAQLKPCTFTWKNDGRNGQGFIAHELQEVIPDAVVGTKDEVNDDGEPEYQGIDPRMIVATLTAAIQELTQRLEALEAK